jgi:hypothetical protein
MSTLPGMPAMPWRLARHCPHSRFQASFGAAVRARTSTSQPLGISAPAGSVDRLIVDDRNRDRIQLCAPIWTPPVKGSHRTFTVRSARIALDVRHCTSHEPDANQTADVSSAFVPRVQRTGHHGTMRAGLQSLQRPQRARCTIGVTPRRSDRCAIGDRARCSPLENAERQLGYAVTARSR